MAGTGRSVAGVVVAVLWAGAAWTGMGSTGIAWAQASPQERLAASFEIMVIDQVRNTEVIPERDQRRTADCLGRALAADIPDAEAEKLIAILEGRLQPDPELQKKWLTVSAKEAPARNAQVMGRIGEMCADVGPYVRGMM